VTIRGFPPIARADARVLILGSMPGEASLKARQYYAHPQNAFWKITGQILGFDPAGDYRVRTAALMKNRIALWDVLKLCLREGSLDSAIDPTSVVANDFKRFFQVHARIRRVCFNGSTAEKLFARHVGAYPDLEFLRLPSTSPANASIPWARKLRAWQAIGA
jgi:TDG/mug DNA glycosylase family protein